MIVPGIYSNVPFEVYASWDAINFSVLKCLEESPSAAWYKRTTQSTTRAKTVGRAVHAAVLESEVFAREFCVAPSGTGSVAKRKELEAQGYAVLSASDWSQTLSMSGNLLNHSLVERVLDGGAAELSLVWTDEATGVLCKARVDVYNEDLGIELDIKTTKNATAYAFSSDCCQYEYNCQRAFYRQGLRANGLEVSASLLAAVSKTGAYEVEVYALEDALLTIGDAKVSRWLEQWSELQESGEWFSVKTLTAPQWYLDKNMETVEDGITTI